MCYLMKLVSKGSNLCTHINLTTQALEDQKSIMAEAEKHKFENTET